MSLLALPQLPATFPTDHSELPACVPAPCTLPAGGLHFADGYGENASRLAGVLGSHARERDAALALLLGDLAYALWVLLLFGDFFMDFSELVSPGFAGYVYSTLFWSLYGADGVGCAHPDLVALVLHSGAALVLTPVPVGCVRGLVPAGRGLCWEWSMHNCTLAVEEQGAAFP